MSPRRNQVDRFFASAQFKALRSKQSRFRAGRVCWACKKMIRSPREFGQGSPGSFDPRLGPRAALRSVIKNSRFWHWICLGKNTNDNLLERIFGRKSRGRGLRADLFCGEIDGLPFRIVLHLRRRRRVILEFGRFSVPSGKGKNLIMGFHLTASQWSRLVGGTLNNIVIGKTGGIAFAGVVRDYLRVAVRTAEFRRKQFLKESRKDKSIQGPLLWGVE